MKNPTFHQTICQSQEWKDWVEYNEKNVGKPNTFDVWESNDCGWLSPEHWKAFLNFIKNK